MGIVRDDLHVGLVYDAVCMHGLRALRMHERRGKVGMTLMTDQVIWRVRRREVAGVSGHCCRDQAPSVAMPHSERQGLRHLVVRDTAGTRHREHLPAEPGIPAIVRRGR